MSGLFREKNLKRVYSPDDLSDYIRVATPSVWLVLLASTILLAGMLVWSILGTVDVENADGTTTTTHPISFVTN